MTEYDTVIVGGGIVGSSVAYHLARAGTETLLVDREDRGRATDAGAGILSPATSNRESGDDWYEFAFKAAEYYPKLVASLEADGIDPEQIGYERPGALRVAISDDEIEPFERLQELIDDRHDRFGRPTTGAIETLSPSAALERFPALDTVQRALYYRDGARVDGRSFAQALREAGAHHGLERRASTVETIRHDGSAIAGVRADGKTIDAANVVIAGGAWSSAFEDDLDTAIPVEPKRGQIVHLAFRDRSGRNGATPDDSSDGMSRPETAAWPIVSAFRHHYIVPWPGGHVAAGATREAGSGFVPYPTAGGVHEALEEALRVAPGLGRAELDEIRVGLRPVSPDGFPVLGSVPGIAGAYVATGHGPSGLLLGPYSGKVVADRVRDRRPEVNINPFEVGRFE